MSNLLANYVDVWERIQQQILKNRFPQALFFNGPRHTQLLLLVKELIAKLICEKGLDVCGQCRSCQLFAEELYPDVQYIHQETAGNVIKIEQIRNLQMDIYQTPQLGKRRFIVIDPADRMNHSAANALLKILEEPPSHTCFILIAEQLQRVPATLLSRCQKYYFSSVAVFQTNSNLVEDYLALGKFYSPESKRAKLYQHFAKMVITLCNFIEKKVSPCDVVSEWSEFELEDLLWFLYLIIAQTLYFKMTQLGTHELLTRFATLQSPIQLFIQLDRINEISRKINHNLNINPMLALESLLLGFLRD